MGAYKLCYDGELKLGAMVSCSVDGPFVVVRT